MNEATCRFCRKSFRNHQAVRAHLRHCAVYRGRQAKMRPRQPRLPVGRPVPQVDEPEADFDRVDDTPPRIQEATSPPPDTGMADLRALLAAHEKRRQDEAAEAKKQKRRQVIQRVKERVVGQWQSAGYTIPAETKARALTDIEHELSALPVDELPEWELVQLAEGVRDQRYGPVMRAQDDAQRLEDQRRREAQEVSRRVAEQQANEARERQQAEARAAALVQYGSDFAYEALQDVGDLDEQDQQRLLQRVERELADQLTGGESKRDVQGLVDRILDEELGESDDDENEGDDEYDDDEEESEEDDDDGDYEDENDN